ncbi:oxidoreductase [Trinickia symbiotica]|uniref:Oxidoreductase n=1 Tax=Trinickia symbiotica TaxID=863227 RepID=A0A2T3XQQ6_9BURK|nr:NAD(P)-dependent oxidoreductase [Trinickia symbiotica]PTB18782.1 oxidoreductase [Trinickia symbiotica]
MNIGFIGIGAMGAGIVRNFLKAGHQVAIWDRFQEPMNELAELGAHVAASPVEAAQDAIVFSMLAHDDAIQDTLIDRGWLGGVNKPLLHVNMATISVRYARKLTELHAAAGIEYVGSPVFGRPDAAAARTLNLIVGGTKSAVERLTPLFDAISSKAWHVGEEPFQANLVKLAGNMMIASAIEAMAEATALGTAHGVDRNVMLDVYLEALFPCAVYRGYGSFIRKREYEPVGFKLPLGSKDIRLALEAGESARVPLPLAGVVRDSLLQALANGYEQSDWSSLAEASYMRAGLRPNK